MYIHNNPIITITEEPTVESTTLTKINYSFGLEASYYMGSICHDSPCGKEDELITRIMARGWGLYKFANTMMLDIPPSKSKVLTLSSTPQEGIVCIRAGLGECFLWDLGGGINWLKGSVLFYAGSIPKSLSLGNPNASPIKLNTLIAQNNEGPISISVGGI